MFATLGATIGMGQFAFGVFIIPLEEEFGWSRTEINISLTLSAFMGILSPFAGRLMDKHGARPVMIVSMILMIIGFFLRSIMTDLWQFYAFSALIFIATPGASMLPVGRLVGLWFPTIRGRMMGIIASGNNFGGMLSVPIITAVIAFGGWRWGFATTGFLMIGLLILIFFVIRDSPEDVEKEVNKRWAPAGDAGKAARAALQGFTTGEAVRTRAFWFLSVGMALQQFARTSVATQFFPHLEQVGFSSTEAAIGLMLLAFFAVTSKILFGTVSEWITARWSYVIVVFLQVIGLAIILFPDGQIFTWIGLTVFGLGMGGVGALGPLTITEMYGLKNFGAIIGLTRPAMIIPTIIGPIMAGVIFDQRGSYDLAFGITLVLLSVALAGFALASPPKRKAGSVAEEEAVEGSKVATA
ncbi:MAG: MFS transporter [Chloroflexi bacterium]|nr:MFS transporter [Chloroflexota bacterium]MBT4074240.1 MFS transporter [Chloroflexota bacterium]MBT5319203.1 MFS transporter [Chloroflexota bacterium]MBT6682954.1 MFS transporter [Chloroflexota bacterium]